MKIYKHRRDFWDRIDKIELRPIELEFDYNNKYGNFYGKPYIKRKLKSFKCKICGKEFERKFYGIEYKCCSRKCGTVYGGKISRKPDKKTL